MAYLLDTNVLIAAKNTYYGFDFCTAFWDWLDVAAKAQFADAADSFLIAQALAGHHTVVTHERISDGRKRIKIPNAASAHGVPWCTAFHMLRAERARFVLEGVS